VHAPDYTSSVVDDERSARIQRPYERPALRPLNRTRRRALVVISALVDLLMLGLALAAATLTRFGGDASAIQTPYGWWIPAWLSMWWLGLLAAGLYDRQKIKAPAEELRRLLYGVTLGAAIAIILAFSIQFPLSRAWLLLSWAFTLLFVALGRRAVRRVIHSLRRRGHLRRRAVIVGADESGRALAEDIGRASWEGLDVVGFISVNASDDHFGHGPILGPAHRLREVTVEQRISDVLVAPTAAANGHLGEVVSALDGVPVDLSVAPGLQGFLTSRLIVQPLADRPLVSIERPELNASARFMKRALDLVLGSILCVLALPVVGVCALAIRLDSTGPVFFRQPRVGLRGRPFKIWKLRTMQADAEELQIDLRERNEADGLLFKIRQDPRITRVGKFLRRFSLDELPQLFNVIAGHMSLVGPRPPLPEEVRGYSDHLGRRLLVKPGITGLWQVSGRSDLSFDDYVRYDLLYVQNWSVALDLYIIIKTLPAVLSGRGAR
jgi:exopolysaccharide biosynthesis polyprenyl glycosylphosphotransferase